MQRGADRRDRGAASRRQVSNRPSRSCLSRTTRSWCARICRGRPVSTESVERVATGAGAAGVGVVDGEALLLDGVDEVDRGAATYGALIRSPISATPPNSRSRRRQGPGRRRRGGSAGRRNRPAERRYAAPGRPAFLVQQALALAAAASVRFALVGGGSGGRLFLNTHYVSLNASSMWGVLAAERYLVSALFPICPDPAAPHSAARIPQVHVGRGPTGSNLAGVRLAGPKKRQDTVQRHRVQRTNRAAQTGGTPRTRHDRAQGQADTKAQRGRPASVARSRPPR